MKRWMVAVSLAACFVVPLMLVAADDEHSDSRIQRGFRISPVPLHMKGLNPDLVGVGSYLVNAIGGCNDCHTCPTYKPGHNPYTGGDGAVNAANFLAGGAPFGPFLKSANLTPKTIGGNPEQGNSFETFETLIRTGHDPDEGNRILQVMPWPIYRNMTDRDLRAIYEYLSAIPPAQPGICTGPGE